MSDYLSHLISRSFKQADAIRPRPTGLFERTSLTDGFTFQHAPAWNASDELHFHPKRAAQPQTPVFPITRTTNAGVPSLKDEPSDPETTETVYPKTGDPVVKSAVSPLTWDETENRLSPFTTDSKDPAVPGDPVHNTPSAPSSDDWIPRRNNLIPRGDDLIQSHSESTESLAKVIRVRQVEVCEHQGDTIKVSPVRSEADKIPGNSERLPSLKSSNVERGFRDRQDMKSIVVKPRVSTHIENIGVVSVNPANRRKEQPCVNVTIGRIEVKANLLREAIQPPQRKKPCDVMTLNDYLSQSGWGGRG